MIGNASYMLPFSASDKDLLINAMNAELEIILGNRSMAIEIYKETGRGKDIVELYEKKYNDACAIIARIYEAEKYEQKGETDEHAV